ncbi:hypothetical protein [Sulfitobacter indolifex]|uniref:hypothetical protein n=1 Tax=Sulfitobacter indolifex TaxID=225422 RepID=UPI000A010996|nr:hypothetical protein [Sulfitobacter indolifex]
MDCTGHISPRRDEQLHGLFYEAATSLLARRRPCRERTSGQSERRGSYYRLLAEQGRASPEGNKMRQPSVDCGDKHAPDICMTSIR